MEPSMSSSSREGWSTTEHKVVVSDVELPADKFVGNQDIQEVECIDGVCQIGERAFKRCTSLRDISLPSTLEILGRAAFGLCESLVSVSFREPKGHHHGYNCGGGLKTVQTSTFFGCWSLCKINIPSTVETIEACAFEDCSSLTELQLQEHGLLRMIGERAFEGCTLLEQVRLPATVEVIEARAFKRCTSLVQIVLSEGLVKIGERALEECKSLERVTLPSTVTILPYGVFVQCISLVDVTLKEGLKTMGSLVFKSCSSLRHIKIPSTVEKIGYSCFYRCIALRDVQLSTGLKVLGDNALANCRSLCAIALPRTLETIGGRAFQGCSKLVTVEFSVKCNAELGRFAFEDCESLTNILIPPSMNYLVDSSVFDGCEQLHAVFRGRDIAKATSSVRFHQYPIHGKCYHASVTTARALQARIGSSTLDDDGVQGHQSYQHLVDIFGMTPFHLLMSSARQRPDLVEVLLNNYPSYILGWKDKCGQRAMDYLVGCDWTEDTKSLMQLMLKAWTMDRLQVWGLEDWQEEMSRRLEELLNEQNQRPRERLLGNIGATMERYERLEGTFLLEMWLWKMKIESSVHQIKSEHRSSCRFQCGASFIVPVVLGWLDKLSEGE